MSGPISVMLDPRRGRLSFPTLSPENMAGPLSPASRASCGDGGEDNKGASLQRSGMIRRSRHSTRPSADGPPSPCAPLAGGHSPSCKSPPVTHPAGIVVAQDLLGIFISLFQGFSFSFLLGTSVVPSGWKDECVL